MVPTTGREVLDQAGLKVTRPRLAILALFNSTKVKHLSAEEVHAQLSELQSKVGLATVYRVLDQFETSGILTRSTFDTGKAVLFELSKNSHHDHLVCSKCGRTEEFLDKRIEDRQRAIAREHGFVLEDHQLTLYGYCSDCAEKKPR